MRLMNNMNATSYRSPYPLTTDEIHRIAPSVFADDKYHDRSESYQFISTTKVIEALKAEGFQPFMVAQTRVRDREKREHTKHMLRFRRECDITAQGAKEIVYVNSHGSTASSSILARGFLNAVCANGLIAADGHVGIQRIQHRGRDPMSNVLEGVYTVVEEFEQMDEQMDAMKSLVLSPDQRLAFAASAMALRYDPSEVKDPEGASEKPLPFGGFPFNPERLLDYRRRADDDPSLWTTYNVVQENLMKGGLRYRNDSRRAVTTRRINSVNEDFRLNKALWMLATAMQQLA